MHYENIELTPEQQAKPEPVFTKPEEYEQFYGDFVRVVGSDLDKQQEARQKSEAYAKQHWVRKTISGA